MSTRNAAEHGAEQPSGRPRAAESEDVVARLVRLTGEPRRVPAGTAERVRDRVHGAWRAGVRRRRRRRVALAASLFAALAASLFFTGDRFFPTSSDGPLATLRAVQDGGLLGDHAPEASFGRGLLETGDGRAALELADGSSLRLDRSTRVELLTRTRLRLDAGALYLDSVGEESFTVETPFGEVRDIGTQFEVRLEPSRLQVRVREGRVDVLGPRGRHAAPAGVELRLDRETVSQRPVARHGSPWQPYIDVAPTFELEGETLEAYLDWLRRETGWRLVYRDPTIAPASATIVLHGALDGLAVTETPGPVLRTCGLGARLEHGVLELFRLSPAASPGESPDPRGGT